MVLKFGPGKAVEEPEENQSLGSCLEDERRVLLGAVWAAVGCFYPLVLSPLCSFSSCDQRTHDDRGSCSLYHGDFVHTINGQ